jgi:hypothetical protein
MLPPPPAEAQAPQKLRFQASFPSSSLIFENLKFWAERVKAMSGRCLGPYTVKKRKQTMSRL